MEREIKVDFIRRIYITYDDDEFNIYSDEMAEEIGKKPTREEFEDMKISAYIEDELRFIPDEIIKYYIYKGSVDYE